MGQVTQTLTWRAEVGERTYAYTNNELLVELNGDNNNNNNNNCLKSNIQKVQWTIINDIHI